MARIFRVSLLLAAALMLGVTGAFAANIPDQDLSIVPNINIVPNNPNVLAPPQGPNTLTYVVQVIGQLGPVADAVVTITIGEAADTLIAWCDGLDGSSIGGSAPIAGNPGTHCPSVITAVAGPSNGLPPGEAHFQLSGGGCVLDDQIGGGLFTAEVEANGVVLGNPGLRSPDVVNNAGETTELSNVSSCDTDAGSPSGFSTKVGVGDATFHTGSFITGDYEWCSDFTDDGVINISDAAFATQFLVNGNRCSCTEPLTGCP